MNFAAFGLFLICCHVWAIETNGHPTIKANNKFEEFLERFKEVIKNGNETFGIPPLDPFIEKELPIEINEQSINVNALLTDILVEGLSAYNVNAGDFVMIPPKASLDLTWPLVDANTNYDLKGTIEDFELYGTGDIKMKAIGFNAQVTVSFTLKGVYVEVKEVTSQFSLEKLDFRATGLFNDEELSELLSAIISDMMPDLIRDYQDEITEQINPMIGDMLNQLLDGKTLSEILEMLGLA